MNRINNFEDSIKGLSLDERLLLAPPELVKSLTKVDIQVLTLKEELFKGSWERMYSDLKNRLESRPYIPKLQKRIEEDLARILKFQRYELANNVNIYSLYQEKQVSKTA